MKKKKVTIDGTEYTVSSSTDQGLKKAISSLRKSIKKLNEDKGHGI